MKWFSNLKIGVKLIAGFITVALIAGIIGFVGIYNIQKINEADSKMYEMMTVPLSDMVVLVESYQKIRVDAKDILLLDNVNDISAVEKEMEQLHTEFDNNLLDIKKTILTTEGEKLIEDIATDKALYNDMLDRAIAFCKEGKRNEAKLLLNGEGNTIRLRIDANILSLKNQKIKMSEETNVSNSDLAKSSTLTMLTLVVIGVLSSLILGIYISNIIKRPIGQLVKASQEIAGGNLTVTIPINSKDEIGTLANAFNDMASNVNEVMSNINTASEQVAAGSKQVSASSMSLSAGASEQAGSVEELTASLEEIASQTRENAENSRRANEISETASTNANEGNQQMKNMLQAMDEINKSSNDISKIIKVIDEIAFQTNILALNAAVEAARAGQHGRGFAVVAEEVRNLAARSANAAKETTDMIEGSIKKVQEGTKIANQTSEALNNIVNDIGKVAVLVNQIAVASNEQALAVDQVNQGLIVISDVVQNSSSTTEETAAASEQLSSQAEMLRNQVARFKLK